MKKFLPLFMAAAISLIGCAETTSQNQHSRPENVEKSAMSEKSQHPQFNQGENSGERGQRPQNMQKNDSFPTDNMDKSQAKSEINAEKIVSGRVESIVGNEVTLLVSENGTEKSEKYLLPVGMKIGDKDFSTVKAGNVLKIYFGTHPDDGSEIIISVEVSSNRR